MFKITHFDKKLCHLLRHHLDLLDENTCEIYSIWNFCTRSHLQSLKNFHSGRCLYKAQYFALIYWFVLIISIMGSIYSFCEFSSLFWGGRKHVTMWRQRTYYVLPPSFIRKCRLVGALIMLNSWLLLTYAVVKVSPTHMTPWLTIKMCVLCCELIIWIAEVLSGVCKLELWTLLSFTLVVANYLFVSCVQSVFEKSIELNDVENLRLWQSF